MHVYKIVRARLGAAAPLIVAVVALGLALPMVAVADSPTGGLQFVVVSDDIYKTTTGFTRPGGSDEDGSGNNGHGNNADGVDSSNPGKGKGGPNGATDPSGGTDDEAGGGGASPSKK